MQFYQCPNCGKKYSEFESKFYCGNCNYRLLKQEDITKIKHPELSQREYTIIGEVNDPTKLRIVCPYCKSENTKKYQLHLKQLIQQLLEFLQWVETVKTTTAIRAGATFNASEFV